MALATSGDLWRPLAPLASRRFSACGAVNCRSGRLVIAAGAVFYRNDRLRQRSHPAVGNRAGIAITGNYFSYFN